MKHLIIYAHPNEDSLSNHFKKTVIQCLKDTDQEFEVRDLNSIHFNPVLSLEDMDRQRVGQVSSDVKKEQDFISWADQITFIYPIWWTGLPAIMKGYIDRVMSYGFAYRYDQGVQKGLLNGKQTIIINSHGKSFAEYDAIGMNQALSLTSDKGIFTYCGLEVKKHFFFDNANRPTTEMVAEWTDQIKKSFMPA